MTVRQNDKGIAHHAPECPECGLEVGTPAEAWEGVRIAEGVTSAEQLICVACGHDWDAEDAEEVALAWYGLAGGDALNGVPLEKAGNKACVNRDVLTKYVRGFAQSSEGEVREAYNRVLRALGKEGVQS